MALLAHFVFVFGHHCIELRLLIGIQDRPNLAGSGIVHLRHLRLFIRFGERRILVDGGELLLLVVQNALYFGLLVSRKVELFREFLQVLLAVVLAAPVMMLATLLVRLLG